MLFAESIKSEIKHKLLKMLACRREFIESADTLSSLGVEIRTGNLYLSFCVESVTKTHIQDLCKKLTLEYANGTPARIEIDSALYCIISARTTRHNFPEFHHDNNLALDHEKLVDRYLDAVNFESITDDINRQASALNNTGLNLIARQLINKLNLTNLDSCRRPVRKWSRIICQTWAFNYLSGHSEISALEAVRNAFDIISNDAGITFGSAMSDYISAAKGLHYGCQKIVSRSVFGKGGHLEIRCFNDKHEFRFSIQAFDSIMAFLTIHGESDIVDLIMGKTDLLAETA